MPKTDPHDRIALSSIGLSLAEAALVCEGLSVLWLSPKFINQMWKDTFATIRRKRIDEKWDVDVDGLLKRLRQLSQPEANALFRAAVRFSERREEPSAIVLSELGLISRRQPTSARRSK